ncbi:ligase-associated DNA damage response endonuclease PdeM [uncultured Cytophaga sp.]|uniref:ligase-associated DNA damage response endonuclease PdeM n=1 Tax=uncultured Cytophaga sp. TaxID=160238 RepID=UPI002616A69F|nr:ligase-associated DNA damage response endonuclease PdeM [uncultured Cytophaga sp.]
MEIPVFHIDNNTFEILPQKALFWKEKQTLILSDLHLGKASHFRKNGMAIPIESGLEDLIQLDHLLEMYHPKRLLILGDLFHSAYNQEWEYFGSLLKKHPDTECILVRGNHDILQMHHYEKYNVVVYKNTLKEGNIIFAHDVIEIAEHEFIITGHIHPGFVLFGKGRQRLALPCFYKKKNSLILPAFGGLTGLARMPKDKDAEIYVSTGERVFRV